MSVFLTPDLVPVAGGTYFPPEDRYGRVGFTTMLSSIAGKVQRHTDRRTCATKCYHVLCPAHTNPLLHISGGDCRRKALAVAKYRLNANGCVRNASQGCEKIRQAARSCQVIEWVFHVA